MSTLAHPLAIPASPRAIGHVLCAVDGGASSNEAVREAVALAHCAARLTFVVVMGAEPPGATQSVSLDERRARQALERAQTLARSQGIDARAELRYDDEDVASVLLAYMDDDCLLVAGHGGHTRMVGAATGSVVSALAHRARGPLLIARAGSDANDLPRRILVAVDDSDAAGPVVRLAGSIAAACHGYVQLVHVEGTGYGAQTRHRLAELSTELIELTGAEPVVDVLHSRHVAASIGDLAARCGSSLLVVGRRGLTGVRALGSVSERLVHSAPCSVLVVARSPAHGGWS